LRDCAGYLNVKADGTITDHFDSRVFFNFLQYNPITYSLDALQEHHDFTDVLMEVIMKEVLGEKI
jgi:hypothetical protein